MARSKLGRKALSVLVATTMVVSLNAPISAWAGNDDATDGAASTEQPQNATGGWLEASSDAVSQADEGQQAAGTQPADSISQATVQNIESDGGSEGSVDTASIATCQYYDAYGKPVGDETSFSSLKEAVKAAVSANKVAVITLHGNTKESVQVNATKMLTLDLNGFTLSNDEGQDTIVNEGARGLVITGKGVVDNTSHACAPVKNAAGAKCTIESAVITRSNEAGKSSGDNGGNSYYYVENFGTMIIGSADDVANNAVAVQSSGKYSSLIHNGWQNGQENATNKPAKMTINSGVFEGGINTIKNDDWGDITINGGVFSNSNQHALFNAHEATVNGGLFESSSMEATYSYAYNSTFSTGQTLINGGTFRSANDVQSDMKVVTDGDVTPASITISDGAFSKPIKQEYCGEGFSPKSNGDGTYGVSGAVARVEDGAQFSTLQKAIDAAANGGAVKLLSDVSENVTINNSLTLDLNGCTLSDNGQDLTGVPVLSIGSVSSRRNMAVRIKDTSVGRNGAVKRTGSVSDSELACCVIDVQGNGATLFVDGGTIQDDSEAGAPLVRVGGGLTVTYKPSLYITGGLLVQKNAPVIDNLNGNVQLQGGRVFSENSEVVVNRASLSVDKNAIVEGTVVTKSSEDNVFKKPTTTIRGGEIDGDVYAVTDGVEGRCATVLVQGGAINGKFGTFQSRGSDGEVVINDPSKATIEIVAGSFSNDPTAWVVEESKVSATDSGYSVEKAYLAEVDGTQYYTMDDAYKAATSSSTHEIKLLRDYSSSLPLVSGTVDRVVDLNGNTFSYTGADQAFEVNYPDVSLTVKNGTVISAGSLLGIAFSKSMNGDINPYNNASAVLENVDATANGSSADNNFGIETSGNNTNDSVVLKNSTLNVPNGFGVYFPSSGSVTIDDSVINAKTLGVQVCAGSLAVLGDKTAINVTGDPIVKTENDGAIEDGSAISIVNRAGYKGLGKIAISAGKFTSKSGNAAIEAYSWDNSTKAENAFDNSAKVVEISGGTFSSNVPDKLIKEGYASTLSSDGNYVVAMKGAESKDDSNKTSGSVATDGVTVDGQQQIADSAAAAAGAVKDASVSEGATTANIGGITVDASGDNAKKVNDVASAANNDNASVDVTLVVKAGASNQPDPKISEKVDSSRTAVVPFTLSVDMVTEVKDSSGTVTASATVPVKETAEPIKVTIAVDPATIAGKKVTVARVHNDAVEYIDPIDVDYDNGLVVFETGKFSEYAVLATDESISYSLPALDENGVRASIDFNMPEGYAFAGWYKDSALTDPYDSSAPGGTAAYPKFVKVSDLITFEGGSLRMDLTGSDDYTKTSLRFGYKMRVPEGATLDREHWGWQWTNPAASISKFKGVENYWMMDGNGVIANLVLTPVYRSEHPADYSTSFEVVAQIPYTTKDGTNVCVKDATRTRSVNQVAEAINANAFATKSEVKYANGILGVTA